MTQRLIQPINSMRVTAGYKNANYRKQFGYNHYGADCTDLDRKDTQVWGSGIGEVVAAGYDAGTGNTLVIVYKNCECPDGKVRDIVQRMWHFASISVKKGDKITKDTRIGKYGNTGSYTTGAHLHHEYDTDIKYPCHSPSFSKSTTIIKAGTDSTLNPTKVLWCKTNTPDRQNISGSTSSDCWTKDADLGYISTDRIK